VWAFCGWKQWGTAGQCAVGCCGLWGQLWCASGCLWCVVGCGASCGVLTIGVWVGVAVVVVCWGSVTWGLRRSLRSATYSVQTPWTVRRLCEDFAQTRFWWKSCLKGSPCPSWVRVKSGQIPSIVRTLRLHTDGLLMDSTRPSPRKVAASARIVYPLLT
jgi:hypothetical protein